jgi:hypothetical protein
LRAAAFDWYDIDYPDGFPDWEYGCPSTDSTSVSVNSSSYLGFLVLIGVIILKKRRDKIKKY